MKETLYNKAVRAHEVLKKLKDYEEGITMEVGEFKVYYSEDYCFYLRVKTEDFKLVIFRDGQFEFSSDIPLEKIQNILMMLSGMMSSVVKELENKLRVQEGNTLFDPVKF